MREPNLRKSKTAARQIYRVEEDKSNAGGRAADSLEAKCCLRQDT
jgi:hypothetical protein